ncbi:hypothetical protein CONCODRAFT_5407 [Conidiobolus coronatus NRRL 28638]|uniref:Helix-turn-helix type 11 domain-containing protein n=1 Tax=Conidiobolus coronatus (strain ATCC 28846 / CBS 209.66 / NRRL 28638) TaxID=796925 RepID=A0A137PAA0_CONC2|nr:hypothetical protein CONCODRAFT_5407 [Conidiobolus coronatus NRRL 28638]|eukprot:KXN71882.1 hypothetical protein CONCODRAFT_5407 [Conidiobolus coronatus NRRL 28638]
MNKLAKLAGVSAGTMFSRIKELNGDGRLNYKFKDDFKFTDEFLIDLVDKNPNLMEKLAKFANVSEDNYKLTDEFLIDLVNNNPTLNMKELAKLAGTSQSVISSRIKQINGNGIRLNYVKKKYRPDGYNGSNSKLTYELLADLIDNNPGLNMEELAELAGVSTATIYNNIKKFEKAGKKLNYCKKDTKKFTDEFLSELINKNPDFNLNELSRLTGVSTPAISKRIIQINSSGKGHG